MKTVFLTKPVSWEEIKKSAGWCENEAVAYEFIQSHDEFRHEFHFPEKELPLPKDCIAIIKWERIWDSDLQKYLDETNEWCYEFVFPKCLIGPLVCVLRTILHSLFENRDTYGEWQKQIKFKGWTLDISNANKGPFWDNRIGYKIDLSLSGKIPTGEKKYYIKNAGCDKGIANYNYDEANRWSFSISHYFVGECDANFMIERFEKYFEPYLRAMLLFLPDEEKQQLPDRWYGYSEEECKRWEKTFGKKSERMKIFDIKYIGGKWRKICVSD